eukprot:scaffold117_cov99-Isochrysis_galbana.AAC.4
MALPVAPPATPTFTGTLVSTFMCSNSSAAPRASRSMAGASAAAALAERDAATEPLGADSSIRGPSLEGAPKSLEAASAGAAWRVTAGAPSKACRVYVSRTLGISVALPPLADCTGYAGGTLWRDPLAFAPSAMPPSQDFSSGRAPTAGRILLLPPELGPS